MSHIAHFGINCAPAEFDEVLVFYLAALKPLGYKVIQRPVEGAVGLGNDGVPDFWISKQEACTEVNLEQRKKMAVHFAFSGHDHQSVQDFHAAALKAGGTCNGKPGYRPYSEGYYAAFIHDPVGNNFEVMCLQRD